MGSKTLDSEIKELLMNTDEKFKQLVIQHHSYEAKLSRLSNRPYLTESEKLEEITLKKKKLWLKDQMHAIISRYRKQRSLAKRP